MTPADPLHAVWAGPYVRIYVDERGGSHFEDVTAPLEPPRLGDSPAVQRIAPVSVTSAILQRVSMSDYQSSWHPAPDRQFVVVMSGEMEIETSDGEIRRFTSGRVLLVEDTIGKGHATRFGHPNGDRRAGQRGVPGDRGWAELLVVKLT